jgi:membrane protein involved in colicin uptake
MYAFFSTASPTKSEQLSPSRERSERSVGSTASPTGSVMTTSSTMSSGVKSRQIRDLTMELEFRDDRIRELVEQCDVLERKAEFDRGEVETRMSEQENELANMNKKHEELQAVIMSQSQQLSEVNAALEQYKSMQAMMAALMGRCKELEETQRAQEEAQRNAKLEAERAAVAAAELAEEEANMKAAQDAAEKEAAAAARRDAEIQAAQEAALAAQRVLPQQPVRSTMNRFRPNSASGAAASSKRDGCTIM